jgi:hypothetical protein
MNTGPKMAILATVVLVGAVGIEIAVIHHRNNEEMVVKPQYEEPKLSDDDAVFLRKLRPDSLKDLRAMVGTTVWMSAGGQMDYYREAGNHVDYAKPVGAMAGVTPMKLTGVFEQVAPKTGRAVFRIAGGQKHVLMVFTLPDSSDPKTLYAMPVGNYDNGSYTFYTDEIFFYDDPHVLFKFWGPQMWALIDKHQVVTGMSEHQVMMSIGEVMKPSSDDEGNRTVVYDNDGHPVTIEYRKDKAVSITQGGDL